MASTFDSCSRIAATAMSGSPTAMPSMIWPCSATPGPCRDWAGSACAASANAPVCGGAMRMGPRPTRPALRQCRAGLCARRSPAPANPWIRRAERAAFAPARVRSGFSGTGSDWPDEAAADPHVSSRAAARAHVQDVVARQSRLELRRAHRGASALPVLDEPPPSPIPPTWLALVQAPPRCPSCCSRCSAAPSPTASTAARDDRRAAFSCSSPRCCWSSSPTPV